MAAVETTLSNSSGASSTSESPSGLVPASSSAAASLSVSSLLVHMCRTNDRSTVLRALPWLCHCSLPPQVFGKLPFPCLCQTCSGEQRLVPDHRWRFQLRGAPRSSLRFRPCRPHYHSSKPPPTSYHNYAYMLLLDSMAPHRCPRSQHCLGPAVLQHHRQAECWLGLEGGCDFHPYLLRLGRWRLFVSCLHPVRHYRW